MSRSSTVVAVRLDNTLHAHLVEWAAMRGQTVSTTIRKCIEAGIGEPAEPEPAPVVMVADYGGFR